VIPSKCDKNALFNEIEPVFALLLILAKAKSTQTQQALGLAKHSGCFLSNDTLNLPHNHIKQGVIAMRLLATLMLGVVLLATHTAAAQTQKRALTPDDLVNLNRIADPRLSPDGKTLLYQLRETDRLANRGRTDIFTLELTKSNAVPQRLATDPAFDGNARWSVDGARIFFLSTRSGSAQIWSMARDGSDLRLVPTRIDVEGFELSPKGDQLAFWADVFPDCEDAIACTKERLDKRASIQQTGQVYDELLVRHWDTWRDGRKSQLFTLRLAPDAYPVRVSKGLFGDVPSKPSGGGEEIAWHSDGTRLVFALRAGGRAEAWSTNLDLYEVPADGSSPAVNITKANTATDTSPMFSPNGQMLAWLAMKRPTFEADRQALMLRDIKTGQTRSIESFVFEPEGESVIARAQDTGTTKLFRISLKTGAVEALTSQGSAADFALSSTDILFAWHNLQKPADFYRLPRLASGKTPISKTAPTQITFVNQALLAELEMGAHEQISFKGANNETVYAWVIKPANFNPAKRYPVAFLVHGGPQASFSDQWHYRWNAQVYAARGYGVVMVDFHGSTGYGQAFTDSISQDWGGKPLEDLQKGLSAALARFGWMDEARMCALGGSYGGYMMSWIASQWPDRFRCLVNHAGIFDNRAMYYSTEELWFVEWEHGGPYFANPQQHEKHNPVLYVDRWKTPQLVTHGQLDFRVPYTQGLSIYTALQRRGVPSRLLIFPDENHWILKPANSVQWHNEVLNWLDGWTKPAS
jgi:dipeptidyl aminopeptidase/acylaminoacyl peptidase